MVRKIEKLQVIGIGLLAVCLLSGSIWINALVMKNNPIEKNFLVPWAGMRTFLDFGEDPYGIPATQRAQVLYYGNVAEEGQDPLYLTLPFPTVLLYFPIALIGDYEVMRGLWMLILEFNLILSAFLCVALFGENLSKKLKVILFIVMLAGAQPLLAIQSGDALPVVIALLLIGIYCIRGGMDEFAGAALIVMLLQRATLWLVMLFLLIWIVKSKRWRIIYGMLMAGGFLVVASFILNPNWFFPFVRAVRNEIPFLPFVSTGEVLKALWPGIGTQVSIILTIGVTILLLIEWRVMRGDDMRWFFWGLSLTLVGLPLSGAPILWGDQFFLFVPVIFIIQSLYSRSGKAGKAWVFGALMVMAGLAGWGLELLPAFKLDSAWVEVLVNLLPATVVITGLYWMRWWYLRPRKTWMDEFAGEG